ncbi:MAG TPA: LLM class F420-dependent oxidoreductase [Candidatus Binataceae bacterium]|nr:LLM class F420-dependent oxidoreductase [Candidatus Binataceae bacterium]
MKFGLFGINNGPCANPKTAAAVARAAESAGFESLWTGEHIIVPDPQAPPSPVAPDYPMLESVIALSYVAAVTTRVRLGTGIIILPQRNPVVLAKEIASADVLSGGRFIFGIGIGYLKPEFDAIGAPFDHKGGRSEEYLRAMIAIWSMEKPAFDGKWIKFSGVNTAPRPVQQPHPEIVFGGHTPEAFSRAARLAKGWYGFAQDVEGTRKCIAGLKEACAKEHRRFEDLEISITPRGNVDVAAAKQYAEAGVHRLILQMRGRDEAGVLQAVTQNARELVGRV